MPQIFVWTGDNATSNDTQNTKMSTLGTNSFNKINRVRCFAHTLNLIAKSILKPFSAPEKKKDSEDADGGDDDDMPDLVSDTASFDGVFTDEGESEEDTAWTWIWTPMPRTMMTWSWMSGKRWARKKRWHSTRTLGA
jgi:hypothetical protein